MAIKSSEEDKVIFALCCLQKCARIHGVTGDIGRLIGSFMMQLGSERDDGRIYLHGINMFNSAAQRSSDIAAGTAAEDEDILRWFAGKPIRSLESNQHRIFNGLGELSKTL